jgi:hypothetical protein
MTSRLAAAVLVLGSACAVLPLASAQPDTEVVKETTIDLPLKRDNWDLRQLDRDPVRLEKYTAIKRTIRLPSLLPNPEKPDRPLEQTSVDFILEFVRDLTVRDTEWTGVRLEPPYRFDFLDADGVTLASQTARYEGIPIGRKGRRVRVVLSLPPEGVMSRVKKVVAEPRRYGDMP